MGTGMAQTQKRKLMDTISRDPDDELSTEELAAIIAVWAELPRIDVTAKEPDLLLSRLLLAERCLKLAFNLEAPRNWANDTPLRLKELREIVILQMEGLAEYDGNPHARAMLDRLASLMDWWSVQPHNGGVGYC
jgi:hypothetical protein